MSEASISMNICPNCQHMNRAIGRFCKHCGEVLVDHATDEPLSPDTDLEELIGLNELKETVRRNLLTARNMQTAGYSFNKKHLHMALVGNAGTGKTLISQLLSRIYLKHKLISNSTLRVVAAVDFGDFSRALGQHIQSLKGGILVIDQAHQLIPANYQPGQSTLLDKLYAEMDSLDDELIIFLLARPEGFRDYLRSNSDISSRFRQLFYLPDLNESGLFEVAQLKLRKEGFYLADTAVDYLRRRFMYLVRVQAKAAENLPNGFLVLNELQRIKEEHFLNPLFAQYPGTIQQDDIKGTVLVSRTVEQVLDELKDFVGMDGVRTFIQRSVTLIKAQQRDATETGFTAGQGFHMVLTGNPGTGKTTVARKLGEVLEAAGVLVSGHVVEVDRSKLVGQYKGETPRLVQQFCDEATGGVLLIDEAYTLKSDPQDSYGQEAIDTLMKRMEDDREKFVVIFAGYQREMQLLLNSNPGIRSRIGDNFFHLDDYTPAQLLAIFDLFTKKRGYHLSNAAEQKLSRVLTQLYEQRDQYFGNGREVRNLFETTLINRAERISLSSNYDLILEADDIPGDLPVLDSEQAANVLAELDKLTGLQNVKNQVRQLADFLEAEGLRVGAGSKKSPLDLHIVFKGNPGTGKTTVARLLARLFKRLNILPKGHLVETSAKDFIAGYVGQSADKANTLINSAMGGVLFIDEAYDLTPNGDQFKEDALTVLLKRMEDDRGRFIVIAAGYDGPMEDLLQANPGLPSRFTTIIQFEDYSPEELSAIFRTIAQAKQLRLDALAEAKVLRLMEELYRQRGNDFANARTVRQQFGTVLQRQSNRLLTAQRNGDVTDPLLIKAVDIPGEDTPDNIDRLLAQLDALIGLSQVKDEISSLISYLEIEQERIAAGGKKIPLNLHMVFSGNPGTGKTTVARLVGQLFKGLGLLPKGQVVEVTDKDLVGEYIGQTAPRTNKVIDSAMGGVLFIDEAYTLTPKGSWAFSQEAIDTLLKRMEDDMGRFVVIAAGYPKEMDKFMDSNPGLASRFTRNIRFEDYVSNEMVAIFHLLAQSRGMDVTPDATAKLHQLCEMLRQGKHFANARTVRNLFETTLQVQSRRLVQLKRASHDITLLLSEITVDDIK